MKKYKLLFLSLFFLPQILLAQITDAQTLLRDLSSLIWGVNGLVGLLFSVVFIFFLWNMMVFILNAGNEEKRTQGKNRMIWGIAILVVMFGIWGIVNILQSVIRLN